MIIPWYVKYFVAAAIVGGLLYKVYDFGYTNAQNKCKADAAIVATALRESQNALQSAIDEIDANDDKIDKLQTELDSANATASGLLDAAKKHSARVCPKASGASGNSQTAKAADDMLPELLSRCAERAVELARYADEIVIAHAKCLSSYETIRNQQLIAQ